MVGNVTIQGQIVGTATFDGAKISAVVTIAPPINATVVFGKSGVSVHNELTGRDAVDAHPRESITGLTIADSPEFANTQITILDSVDNGGVIPNAEATWIGATAKSVLSYLQKLVSKVYAINSRVEVLENNVVVDITTTQIISSLTITTDKNGNPLNLQDFDIIILGIANATINSATITLNNNISNIVWNGINNLVRAYLFAYINGYIASRFAGIIKFRKSGSLYVFSHMASDVGANAVVRSVNFSGYTTTNIGNITSIKIESIDWATGVNIRILKR